jgi:hypothetical protein
VNRLHRAVLAALTEAAEAPPRWDWPPQLLRVYVRGDVLLAPVNVVALAGPDVRPPEVLDAIADGMAASGFRDPDLLGMAFVYEGWTVPDPVTARQAHVAAVMAGDHRLHEHPDRIEIRMAMAVDRHGATYHVEHQRAGSTRHLLAIPGRTPELEFTGSILLALDRMVEQLCGVTLPQRRPPYNPPELTEEMN